MREGNKFALYRSFRHCRQSLAIDAVILDESDAIDDVILLLPVTWLRFAIFK